MPSDRFSTRRDKLIRKIRKLHVDGFLVSSETNVSYLTGFSGDSSFLLLTPQSTLLVSDSRYATQIAEECPGLDAVIRANKETTLQTVARTVRQSSVAKMGFESQTTTVEQHDELRNAVKSAELVPFAGLVEELRAIKDRHEIAEIRKAIRQAERGFAVIRAGLTRDMTERKIAQDLEHAMRRFGAEREAFHTITAFDERAALPHARPTGRAMNDANLLLIDWGAETPGGYRSDLTRVLVTGRISTKLHKVYEVVLNAQRLAIEAIRPNVELRTVDAVARNFIKSTRFGKRFGHGLGHGIGLDIHENPRLSPISTGCLKPGMVVTVEPGVYLPGWGGVRIEDDVLVTRNGYEVLTSVPKTLDEMLVNR